MSTWDRLRTTTQSRIGQPRTGDTVDTRTVLELRAAHAVARDAVHLPLDLATLVPALDELGLGTTTTVSSQVPDRAAHLTRPDLGRRVASLEGVPSDTGADVGIVVVDGLSTTAVAEHAVPMVEALAEVFAGRLALAPVVVATDARVAIGDEIGERMGVDTLLVLVGERPGLSVADSLGIYLTHRPRPGRRDSERNCVSNVHPPGGLGYAAAARTVAALVDGARTLGESGVRLKDSSRELH